MDQHTGTTRQAKIATCTQLNTLKKYARGYLFQTCHPGLHKTQKSHNTWGTSPNLKPYGFAVVVSSQRMDRWIRMHPKKRVVGEGASASTLRFWNLKMHTNVVKIGVRVFRAHAPRDLASTLSNLVLILVATLPFGTADGTSHSAERNWTWYDVGLHAGVTVATLIGTGIGASHLAATWILRKDFDVAIRSVSVSKLFVRVRIHEI